MRWVVVVVLALLAGCSGTVPPPSAVSGSPSAVTPSPSVSPSSVLVPVVPTEVRSRLLVEDPGLVFKRPEESPQAPASFAVVGDQVVVDDYLKDRFAIYEHRRRVLELDEPTPVADMEIRDGVWYVLGPEATVTAYRRVGKGLKRVRRDRLPDPPAGMDYRHLWFEGVNLVAAAADPVLVEGPGPVLGEPEETMVAKHTLRIRDGKVDALVPLKWSTLGTYRIGLTDRSVFYSVADSGDGDNDIREFVLQFNLDGSFVHSYSVYRSGSTADGRDFVVSGDRLYQMWISDKTVKVFEILPNP